MEKRLVNIIELNKNKEVFCTYCNTILSVREDLYISKKEKNIICIYCNNILTNVPYLNNQLIKISRGRLERQLEFASFCSQNNYNTKNSINEIAILEWNLKMIGTNLTINGDTNYLDKIVSRTYNYNKKVSLNSKVESKFRKLNKNKGLKDLGFFKFNKDEEYLITIKKVIENEINPTTINQK